MGKKKGTPKNEKPTKSMQAAEYEGKKGEN